MNQNRFLVLTNAGDYIDYNLLGKGLYRTATPKLFSTDTTIDALIKQGEFMVDLTGKKFIDHEFFANLQLCSLTLIELSVVK